MPWEYQQKNFSGLKGRQKQASFMRACRVDRWLAVYLASCQASQIPSEATRSRRIDRG